MRSDLVGGHDPQLADGGVAGAGNHVGDAVGDVLGGEDLGLLVEGAGSDFLMDGGVTASHVFGELAPK